MARTTLTTRVTAIESEIAAMRQEQRDFQAQVLAALNPAAPAVTPAQPAAPKAPRKARKAAQPKAAAPLPKGVRTVRAAGGTLSRTEWNRTLTCLAKTRTGKDSGAYKHVLAVWDLVQEARAEGYTPREVLVSLGYTVREG